MRVAKWYNNKDVRVEEMPVPKIGQGELLVEANGICRLPAAANGDYEDLHG